MIFVKIFFIERTRLNDLQFTFSDEIFNRGLIEIEDKVVCLSEKYLAEFGMNSPVRNENASDPLEFSILRFYDNNRLQEFVEINLPKLVNYQKYAFNVITESVMNHQGRVFF